MVIFALALASMVTLYGVAIARTYRSRRWWAPGAIVSGLGVAFMVVMIALSHGRELDGLGLFLAGIFYGGLAIVFGCIGLVVAALLHARRRA